MIFLNTAPQPKRLKIEKKPKKTDSVLYIQHGFSVGETSSLDLINRFSEQNLIHTAIQKS